MQVVLKLLDPKTSEFTATFVGRLVTVLITKMGSRLGNDLDLMLRAVLSKLQQAETLSVIQVRMHLLFHKCLLIFNHSVFLKVLVFIPTPLVGGVALYERCKPLPFFKFSISTQQRFTQ